jgi:hypothetical protein
VNLFVALVGPSGGGKGVAQAVGTEVLDVERAAVVAGERKVASFATHTVGSGQGIGHAYRRWEKGRGMVQYAESALFSVEEVDHLIGLTGQSGSTLLPELRRVFMGERLGHLYVDVHKRVELPAHSYRAGLVIGVQPARAGVLLDDSDGGTPQRLLWFETTYPHADERPAEPEVSLQWEPPDWAVNESGPVYPGGRLVTMGVPDVAAAEIDAAALARARGQGDPLDGHRLLAREKVAAGLAILAGRPDITDDDWTFSGMIMAHSDGVRERVQATLVERAQQKNAARAHVAAAEAVYVADVTDDRGVEKAAQGVLRYLDRHEGEATHGKLQEAAGRNRGTWRTR